jgi:hypothetical protein
VAVPVFSLSGQGQNRLFASHFVLPSPARTCVADGERRRTASMTSTPPTPRPAPSLAFNPTNLLGFLLFYSSSSPCPLLLSISTSKP